MDTTDNAQLRCGHSKWAQCSCAQPIRDAHKQVTVAINDLADAFSKWGHGRPHDSTCIVFEIGLCYCSVHDAMRALDEKYRAMVAAIDRVYEEAVA